MTCSPAQMPSQEGRGVLVTGPSSGGLGYVTALEFARRGAHVVLAGRNPARIQQAADGIRSEVPNAWLEPLVLDLASLASVREAAADLLASGQRLDVLINNAGVMGTPAARTVDGLDLQMATNHFGPFLLTGLLLPLLAAGGEGRVVCVSSQFHRFTRTAPLDDPRSPRGRSSRWTVYGQTKLANLLMIAELDRRCRAAGLPVLATAAHPGFAGTHLAANGQYGRSRGGVATILDATIRAVSQSAAAGAWPTLMAATADLPGGAYCGPSGAGEMSGPPHVVRASRQAYDTAAARRLWEISEDVVGLRYP